MYSLVYSHVNSVKNYDTYVMWEGEGRGGIKGCQGGSGVILLPPSHSLTHYLSLSLSLSSLYLSLSFSLTFSTASITWSRSPFLSPHTKSFIPPGCHGGKTRHENIIIIIKILPHHQTAVTHTQQHTHSRSLTTPDWSYPPSGYNVLVLKRLQILPIQTLF